MDLIFCITYISVQEIMQKETEIASDYKKTWISVQGFVGIILALTIQDFHSLSTASYEQPVNPLLLMPDDRTVIKDLNVGFDLMIQRGSLLLPAKVFHPQNLGIKGCTLLSSEDWSLLFRPVCSLVCNAVCDVSVLGLSWVCAGSVLGLCCLV